MVDTTWQLPPTLQIRAWLLPAHITKRLQGRLYLSDFGLSRSPDRQPSVDSGGTVQYAAPEVLCSEPRLYSKEGDIYALGSVAFYVSDHL